MNLRSLSFLLAFVSINFLSFSQANSANLTNEMIWTKGLFYEDYLYSVRSMADGEHFTALDMNGIAKFSYANFDKSEGVIYNGNQDNITIDDYFFNADESKILIATNMESIYRRSFSANYYVVDLKTKKTTLLFDKGPQMLADFSPDGTKIAFVYENNIYIKNLIDNRIEQVTSDGKQNEIINGSADWVYEEEFEVTKAFYWSPKGSKLAYLKFDERKVPEFSMDYYYGKTYPTTYTFKYPKAGEANSKLSLFIYGLDSKKTSEVLTSNYEYIPRMRWTNDDNKLVFIVMNRHQNELSYVSSTISADGSVNGEVFYSDKSDTYLEIDNNLLFLADGSGFLRTSEKSGFKHIYFVDFAGKERQITSGEWDVVSLKGINEEKGIIYYISAEEGPIYKSLYSIHLDGSKKTKLSTKLGENEAEFSEGMKYYMNYYSNANEPTTITLNNSNGKELRVLMDNADLKNTLSKLGLSKKEFIKIKGVEHDLNAFIIKPKNFDQAKKYPVYFDIYNGPGHNTVTDAWGGNNFMYHQLLAQKGYIIISVDTRGTMFRGTKFKNSTYLQLGKLETEDMIAVAKEVGKWEFVDAKRIGVMGWSYGGYMSSLCMTKGADYFKMGIAVAPVTNWRWYDNIYTERFMRTPQENANGYDDNSPINHVDKMKGKYLLVHGSGDDNVHVQNSMEMSEALVKKNKDFEMFIYTNKNHGIYGGKTREHLFNKLLNFTLTNL